MTNIKVNDIKSASADNKVNDIKLAGAELFEDAESFINDLSDNELELAGGCGNKEESIGNTCFAGLCSNIIACWSDRFFKSLGGVALVCY